MWPFADYFQNKITNILVNTDIYQLVYNGQRKFNKNHFIHALTIEMKPNCIIFPVISLTKAGPELWTHTYRKYPQLLFIMS